MNKVEIDLLGAPTFLINTKIVKFSRKKTLALMIYLICNDRKILREELAELLWTNYSQSKAFSSLRTIISEAKSLFPKNFLIIERNSLYLEKNNLTCDYLIFKNTLKKKSSLKEKQKIAKLWKGGFIKGFDLNSNCEFTTWQIQEEQNIYFLYKQLLKSLYEKEIQEQDLKAALNHAKSCLSLDNFDEETHRAIMNIYALRGDKTYALKQYELCQKIMKEEFNSPLEEETQELFRKIRTGEINTISSTSFKYFHEPRLAIIPFHLSKNINKETSLFIDMMMEGLEDYFAKASGIKIISRTSSMTYANTNKRISIIAKELLVDYIIEGFIALKENNLIIESRLIDTKLDTVIKIKKINIITFNDEKPSNIAKQIGKALISYFLENTKFNINNHKNNQIIQSENTPLTKDIKLQAKHLLRLNNEIAFSQAIELYREAKKIDPNDANTYAQLAKALYSYSTKEICCPNQKDRLLEAQIEAERAIEINSKEPIALNILGNIALIKDWDFIKAESLFKKTLKISPHDSQAMIDYAELCILLARQKEARKLINMAIELDPVNHQNFKVNFWLHLIEREYDKAKKIAKHQFILFPAPNLEKIMFSYIYLIQNKINIAIKTLETINEELPISWKNSLLAAKGFAFAKKGLTLQTYKIIEQLQQSWEKPVLPHLPIALIYIGLNEYDNALEWIDAAVKLHDSSLFFLIANPLFSPLFEKKRLKEILYPTHIIINNK